jgi:periplasmic protein TonB
MNQRWRSSALLALVLVTGCAASPPVNDQGDQPTIETTRSRQVYTTVVEALVGIDGSVKDARIAQSSGLERADEMALDEIRKRRLTPGTKDGQPVQTWGRYAVTFAPID